MDKINAVITGVGGYVPEDVLTNEDISKMVDTTDEWIMTRVGIKERRILKGEGVGLSYMGIRAVKQLLEKTNLNPEEVEVVLTATTTPDHHFPTTSSIIAYHTGCKNAMTFDMQGACAGFLYALETGANYIRSGRYKKVVVVSGDKMNIYYRLSRSFYLSFVRGCLRSGLVGANYRGVRCLGYYFTDRRRRLSASDHEIGRLGLSSFSRDGGQP